MLYTSVSQVIEFLLWGWGESQNYLYFWDNLNILQGKFVNGHNAELTNLGIIVENKMSEIWSFQKNCDSGYQYIFELMSGSSHIQSVLIGIKYRNYCRTLDGFFYVLLFG